MVFQGNNEYMYGAGGRPMSPPPGDEEALPSNENLPTALEEALAYKEHRLRELGHFGQVSVAPKTGENDKENVYEALVLDEKREDVLPVTDVPEKAKSKSLKKKKEEEENKTPPGKGRR